jgi:hypothetical protein
MNKLKTMLCAACALFLVMGVSARADSSNFAGPYIGIQALGLGAEFEGTSKSSAGTSSAVTDTATVGVTKGTVGAEAGYVLPMGSMLALDVGIQYLQGEGKIAHTNSNTTGSAGNAHFTIDDHVTYYIAPTLVLSDTSSLYLKAGVTQADTGVSGDVTTPGQLTGEMYAIGTRTVLASGIFIRTEAGFTEYNGISAHGKGGGTAGADIIDQNTSFAAEPTIVHGSISLGFRF